MRTPPTANPRWDNPPSTKPGAIQGEKIPTIPYLISQWHNTNPDTAPPDGLTLTQPYPANAKTTYSRDQVVYYRYSADRAPRSLRGITEQVDKAEKAVAGKIPVKRNRFVTLTGAEKSVNRTLEAKARTLAGWKVYATNIDSPTAEFVIDSYHQLWRIEKSFRMSKPDLAARPIFHHTEDSIRAHLPCADGLHPSVPPYFRPSLVRSSIPQRRCATPKTCGSKASIAALYAPARRNAQRNGGSQSSTRRSMS